MTLQRWPKAIYIGNNVEGQMLSTIGTGQLIGGCIEDALWTGVGVYIVWIWPRHVRRDIATGKISEAQGLAKLKKFNPRFGFLVIIYGLVRMASDLFAYL